MKIPASLRNQSTVTFLVILGVALLCLSYLLPYWNLELRAPQYPEGLHLSVYMNRVAGDVNEVNILNHYIGMSSLDEAAKLEREYAWVALLVLCVSALVGIVAGRKVSALFYVPPLAFLAGFVADMLYWLYQAGHRLNPDAPVDIQPFMPVFLGRGEIGQFKTFAMFGSGFWLATVAIALILLSLRLKGSVCRSCSETPRCRYACLNPKDFLLVLPIFFLWGIHAPDAASANELQQLLDDAGEGEIIRIPPGRYVGNFHITKPLSLRAEHDVILDGNWEGSVLKVTSPGVLIEGLIIENSGDNLGRGDSGVVAEGADDFTLKSSVIRDVLFGAQVLNCKRARISGNRFTGSPEGELGRRGDAIKIWYSPGAKVTANHISDARDVLVWYSDDSLLAGNAIERMRYGIHYMYSHRNRVEGNTLSQNSVGIYGMYSHDLAVTGNRLVLNRGPSGYGLAIKESDRLRAVGNLMAGNRVGLHVDNSPMSPPGTPDEVTLFELNRIEENDVGVNFIGTGSGRSFVRNDFIENWQQISSQRQNGSDTVWRNNFWSDYRGVSAARIPYQAGSLATSMTDRFESFKLFRFGPALMAIEFAERMIPWLKVQPIIVDPTPALEPHTKRHLRAELRDD